MSSPIHTASCVARAHDTVDIELGPTPACGVHFPFTRLFGLGLIHEAAAGIVYSRPGVVWKRGHRAELAGALRAEKLIDLAGKPPSDPERRRIVATYVEAVCYVGTRNWSPYICQPSSGGSFETPTDLSHPGPRGALAVLQGQYDEAAKNESSERYPYATIRVRATEARWLDHLQTGMLWDVYAFDDHERGLI